MDIDLVRRDTMIWPSPSGRPVLKANQFVEWFGRKAPPSLAKYLLLALLPSACAPAQPTTAESGKPVQSSAAAPGGLSGSEPVARVTVRRAGNVGNSPVVTFGSLFGAGELSATQTVAAALDGQSLPVQLDAKAFHPDGSVRHGIVSASIPGRARRAGYVLELRRAVAASTPMTTAPPAVDLPAGFDTTVLISEQGRIYRASVRQLLDGGPVRPWLSGPLVNEWHVSGPLVSHDGIVHPALSIHFYVRAPVGREEVRVDVIVENTWAFATSPRNVTYDVEVRVGDEVRAREAGVEHYRQARWRKVFWWGDEPAFEIAYDLSDLVDSGAIPNYNPAVRFSEQQHRELFEKWKNGVAPNGLRSRATMGPGLLYPSMPDTGDRPDIGPLPRWTVQYLVSADSRVREAMLGTADQAGSFPVHYRDAKTGQPVSIEDYPGTSIGQPDLGPNPLPRCSDDCDVPYKTDTAHLPSMAFVPYLITGDFYYLEEMLFWGTYINLFRGPSYRHGSKGILKTHQVRGQAWSLRTLGQIDWILPADHPQKAYWSRILRNNIEYYTRRYVGSAGQPPVAPNDLGLVTEGVSWSDMRLCTSWMDDFFTWAVHYLVGLGYEQARPLYEFKVISVIERMANDDFCWVFAATNYLYFRDSASAPPYDNYAEVYENSVDSQYRQLPCGSAEMGRALGLQKGEMLRWRRQPPRGFPLYMQIALAAAVDSGNEKAAVAWQRWEGRANPRDPNRSPEWSILPRDRTVSPAR